MENQNNQCANAKFCSNCGNQVLPDDKFCVNCGIQITNDSIPDKENISISTPNMSTLETPQTRKKFNKKILIPIIAGASTTFVLILFIFLTFTHIICINHDWRASTCIEPAQCYYCDKYKDDILGNHKWMDATCTSPRTCFWCDLEEGEPLGHQEKTSVTQQPTLVSSGTEIVTCSICEEVIDNRTISKKVPKAEGKSFNFTDDELIDWINDKSTAEVEHTELGIFNNNKNTSYRITLSNGEKGALLLNHGDNDTDGNVCAIMVYFENTDQSSVFVAWIGEKINSNFSSEDAFYKFVYGASYTAAGMTAMDLELDDDFTVYILASSEYLADIVS